MAAGKSSRVNSEYKTKYRIRNWKEYERGLRSRGDVKIWLSGEAIAAWTPAKNGLRGGQRRYSNVAILTALTLRVVFRLPLRQTEGFLDSLLGLMGLALKAPDHGAQDPGFGRMERTQVQGIEETPVLQSLSVATPPVEAVDFPLSPRL